MFGDSDAELAIELREQFPQAVLRLSTPDQHLAEAVRFVLSRLTEHPTAQTLPFHVRATAFQQRVWQALLEIPRGETRTYSQIAEAVGSPKAVRAVGTACGSNLLAVVIPCHRVVGSDGKLTGYRWGTDRKRQLCLEQIGKTSDSNRTYKTGLKHTICVAKRGLSLHLKYDRRRRFCADVGL